MTKDGALQTLANTQHSRLIILFLLGWFLLSHGNLFGRLGLLGGANSSFGCLQIGWPTGVCLTPSVVLCMSKSLRQSIISYQVASSPGTCGHSYSVVMVCWISPIPVDKEFYGWWLRIVALVSRDIKGGLNTLLTLGAWTLWKHHDSVFNRTIPSIQLILNRFWRRNTSQALPH